MIITPPPPPLTSHFPGRSKGVPKNVVTSPGRPHMVLYIMLRDASAAERPWEVLRTSL